MPPYNILKAIHHNFSKFWGGGGGGGKIPGCPPLYETLMLYYAAIYIITVVYVHVYVIYSLI